LASENVRIQQQNDIGACAFIYTMSSGAAWQPKTRNGGHDVNVTKDPCHQHRHDLLVETRPVRMAAFLLVLSVVQVMLSLRISLDNVAVIVTPTKGQLPVAQVSVPRFLPQRPPVRLLLGIYSTNNSTASRQRHRENFQQWNRRRASQPLVCSLSEWQRHLVEAGTSSCALIYTFVIGAAGTSDDLNVPSVIVNDQRPLLVNRSMTNISWSQELDDLTLLNIRENEHEGKSQTWFRYASQLADQTGLEYVAKADADSFLDMAEYFAFANRRLRPTPYNTATLAGGLRDKNFWKDPIYGWKEKEINEKFLYHLYMSGG
jgi:hypothetical protein